MAALHDRDLGKDLCKILGLDPGKTRDIIIKNPINDWVTVEVTQILLKSEADKLIEVLSEYELHKKQL